MKKNLRFRKQLNRWASVHHLVPAYYPAMLAGNVESAYGEFTHECDYYGVFWERKRLKIDWRRMILPRKDE